MAPYPNRNRDGQQVIMTPGVRYSEHQEVRDLVYALRQEVTYVREAGDRFDKNFTAADKEWDGIAEMELQRIMALEKEVERNKGKSEGILSSAAFISGVLTLIGMFLAIYISVVVR